MAADKDKQYGTTLLRGLKVLRAFARSSEMLTVSDLVRETGMPQPTVWRFCRALESEGYLVSDQQGTRFRPGLAVLDLGFAALSRFGIAELARPELLRLATDFTAVAGMAVPEGDQVRYIQRFQAPDAVMSFNIRVGWSLPMTKTSSGWAFLAAMTETERRAAIAAIRKSDREGWNSVEARFQQALDAYPALGAMVTVDVLYPGLSSVAVAIVDDAQRPQYAVYCTGASAKLTPEILSTAIAPRLLQLVEQLRPSLAFNV